ncbi:PAS domain S-box protein [Thiobaca trueperi]|uniref:histidine kinase n=1 Tax=Thiobaca trueperi TaxID=127458 RepID=A0A4R3MTC8_9GAMM|nr:PAS domain S-box protein [Thiobaca trueperi]TCT19678.1 PAS domain S-box-containing protein [Thiobaca trueperi]
MSESNPMPDTLTRQIAQALERGLPRIEASEQPQHLEGLPGTIVDDVLQERKELYRAIFNLVRDGVAIFDPEVGIIEVNARFAEMLGYTPQEMLGMQPWDINAEMNEADIRAVFPDPVTTNTTLETRNRRKDGSMYDVEVSIRGARIDGRPIIVCIDRDISERKAQQRTLEEREALLAAIFDQAGVGIDLIDVETLRFVQFNRTSHTLLGYSADEFSHLRLPDIHALPAAVFEPRFQQKLVELRKCGTLTLELRPRRRDGSLIDSLVTLRLLNLQGREHILAVWNDITQQKTIERELARRDAILTAVANLSLLFLKCSQWTEAMDEALGQLGAAARVSRAYLFESHIDDDGRPQCSLRFEWCAKEAEPQIANVREQGFDWQAHGLLHWYGALSRGEPVVARQTTCSAAERRLLESLGIRSALIVPLFANGEFLGFLGLDDCAEERDWSLAEIAALRSAAGVIGAAAEKAEVQRQLMERERRYTLATDAGKVGVWEWDLRTGQVQLFTHSVLHRSLGYDTAETTMNIDQWIDRMHPDDRVIAQAIRRRVEADDLAEFDEVLRVMSLYGGDRSLAFRGSLMRDRQGRPVKVFGTAIDLTERRQMEDNLRRANEEWSKTFDTVPDAIVIMDNEGRIIKTNRAYTESLGVWSDDLLYRLHLKAYDDIWPRHDRSECPQDDRVYVTEIDGGPLSGFFRITSSRLYDDRGDPRGSIHVIHDISDRHWAEQARLTRLQEQKDVLIREVHHRIKNHLQGLLGLLSQNRGQAGNGGDLIDKAMNQVKSIAAVYGLQSREAGSDVCLLEILEAIVCNARALGSVPVRLSIQDRADTDLFIAREKAVTLALVINELLQNALKWRTLGASGESVQVTYREETDSIQVTMTNPGVLPRGFDFATGYGLGTGLGLVRDMLPRQGATLGIAQTDGHVTANLTVQPPLLVVRTRATAINRCGEQDDEDSNAPAGGR